MTVGQGVLSVKSVLSPVDKEKYARCDTAPMLRAREACCSITFQSREWGQLWVHKIYYINFTFNIIILCLKYGGRKGRHTMLPRCSDCFYLFIFNNDIIIISFRRVSLNSAMFYNLMWGQLWVHIYGALQL